MNIYVGNLSFDATEADLENAFAEFGEVTTVNIVKDRDTGRPRGFAFVEMRDTASGKQAIQNLNEQQIAGRNVTVNEAKPRENRGGGGSGGRGGKRGNW
jgi:cold-inducible RNA-binding protein